MNREEKKRQINIRVPQDEAKGAYANFLRIMQSREEFVLDFGNVFGNEGVLTARIFVSPGHLKRIVKVLAATLKKYEDKWGEIEEGKGTPKIGF